MVRIKYKESHPSNGIVYIIQTSRYNALQVAVNTRGPTWRLAGEFGVLLQGLVDIDAVWGEGSSP